MVTYPGDIFTTRSPFALYVSNSISQSLLKSLAGSVIFCLLISTHLLYLRQDNRIDLIVFSSCYPVKYFALANYYIFISKRGLCVKQGVGNIYFLNDDSYNCIITLLFCGLQLSPNNPRRRESWGMKVLTEESLLLKAPLVL